MVVGEQHGCLLERHPAPPTCCGTPAGGFFVLPHRTASGSSPCPGGGCPRLPTYGVAPVAGHRRAPQTGPARPRPPVAAGASSPARPVPRSRRPRLRPTPGAGCGSVRPRFLLRWSDARPAWRSHRPMRSIKPVRRGGHDRARCPAVSAVRTGGSRVVVGVSRSSAAASASQAGSCATSRSVPRRSARQPARPAGSSQGPPDSPAAGSAAADGVEVEVAGSAAADVGGSTDVGGRVVAGGSAVVRVGRVVGVAVSLGDSVTLGAGRVPERWSRYGSTKCCHQVLQLPSSRASPIGASPPDQRAAGDHVPAWGGPLFGGDPPQHHPKQVRTRSLTGHPSERQAKPN
jgi:hypothetical protein